MKKQYQISKRGAVEHFQKWAAENRTPLQLRFETTEMAELSKASLGDLLRTIGKLFIEKVRRPKSSNWSAGRARPTRIAKPIDGEPRVVTALSMGSVFRLTGRGCAIGKTTRRSPSAVTNCSSALP